MQSDHIITSGIGQNTKPLNANYVLYHTSIHLQIIIVLRTCYIMSRCIMQHEIKEQLSQIL